jgi:hypothetical protein
MEKLMAGKRKQIFQPGKNINVSVADTFPMK